ncbi:MAG: acyltransferase [Kiritimatiellia bacterium]|jgi:acetyltransferase-like isoleucine patch superfamily enzyme|nr:acyltransferase [Kiritimatiellia bacterium]
MYAWFIAGPVLRSVAEVGESLRIEKIPYIRGPGRIVIGDRAYISGKVDVAFSRQSGPAPTLVIGDDVFIGHECSFAMARGIEIGSHCLLAGGVRIQDNDGHPLDAARRHAGEPVDTANVKPVRIEDGVWIGQRCQVLKGVTIGRNSVIGAGSVVTKDIPADSLAAGVPAKVIRKLKDES